MSHAVICDACGTMCRGNQYFSINGWMGKGACRPSRKKKEPAWEIKPRKDILGVSADICLRCLESHIALNRLNLVKTRRTLLRELKAEKPQMSGFEVLRRTTGGASTAVTCDLCQSDCLEKHLAIKSGWLTENGEELTAELCEKCTCERLLKVIQSTDLISVRGS